MNDTSPAEHAGPDIRTGFRKINADFTSSHGFRWPFPGDTAVAPGPLNMDNKGPCPRSVGDGLCVAKTFVGANSGGLISHTYLVVRYNQADVLGEDADKVRITAGTVTEVLDLPLLIRTGYLTRAYLTGADLTDAYLTGADLTRAYLAGADLTRANLADADLAGANLTGAYLTRADLTGANLTDAKGMVRT